MIPGEIITRGGEITLNADRRAITLEVANTAVRFEPGQTREVQLVPIAGARAIYGFNGLVMGPLEPGAPGS